MPGEQEISWPVIRYERAGGSGEAIKLVRVTDCPLQIIVEPWSEGQRIDRVEVFPARLVDSKASRFPDYTTYRFEDEVSAAEVRLNLQPSSFVE
jgi:hypothetical protein